PRANDSGPGCAVEGTFEGDDAETFRMTAHIMKAPRHLEGALASLRTRIGEEHRVSEGVVDESLGKSFLAGNAIEVGCMPQAIRLLAQRRDQFGVGVAESVDR